SALGGVLAQPAEHFPETFSATGLLGTYPFLLPNLFGAGFSLLVLVLFVLYVPETIDLEKESSSSKLGSPRSSDVATLALPSSEEYSPRDHPQNAHRPLNGSGKEGRLAPGYVALEDSKDKRDGCAINQDDQQGLADDDAGSRLRSDEDGGKNCGGI
ncbi:unnamed protein product, partial [Ectocarpus sp. 12 AP-2014]